MEPQEAGGVQKQKLYTVCCGQLFAVGRQLTMHRRKVHRELPMLPKYLQRRDTIPNLSEATEMVTQKYSICCGRLFSIPQVNEHRIIAHSQLNIRTSSSGLNYSLTSGKPLKRRHSSLDCETSGTEGTDSVRKIPKSEIEENDSFDSMDTRFSLANGNGRKDVDDESFKDMPRLEIQTFHDKLRGNDSGLADQDELMDDYEMDDFHLVRSFNNSSCSQATQGRVMDWLDTLETPEGTDEELFGIDLEDDKSKKDGR